MLEAEEEVSGILDVLNKPLVVVRGYGAKTDY